MALPTRTDRPIWSAVSDGDAFVLVAGESAAALDALPTAHSRFPGRRGEGAVVEPRCSLTHAPCTLRSVWVARWMPSRIATSKLSFEVALISVMRATVIAVP